MAKAGATEDPLTHLEPPVRLSLAKEVLAELSTSELAAVNGGVTPSEICATDPCITQPVSQLRCLLELSRTICA